MDLSFNQFKVDDVRLLGEGLKLNHRILGIHLMGNEATVDELGFVTPEKTLDQASLHVFTRIPGKLALLIVGPRQTASWVSQEQANGGFERGIKVLDLRRLV